MLSVFVASFRKLIKVLILNLGLCSFFEPNSNTVYEKSLNNKRMRQGQKLFHFIPKR